MVSAHFYAEEGRQESLLFLRRFLKGLVTGLGPSPSRKEYFRLGKYFSTQFHKSSKFTESSKLSLCNFRSKFIHNIV
jgi:hypothetical protein